MPVESFNACVYLLDRQVLARDALPKTATGEIQRGVVREVLAQRLAGPRG